MLALIVGRCHSDFWRHFQINNPIAKSGIRHCVTRVLAPLRKAFGFAPCGNEQIGPSVSVLLQWCSPSAIAWRVSEAVIYSFYGFSVLIFSFSCPLKKNRKRSSPFIAHVNAATAVTRKCTVRWVVASAYHVSPDTPNSYIMPGINSPGLVHLSTSNLFLAVARLRCPVLQIVKSIYAHASTLTSTFCGQHEISCLRGGRNVVKKSSCEFKHPKLVPSFWNYAAMRATEKIRKYFWIIVEWGHGRFTPVKCFGSGADSVSRSVRPVFIF